MKFDDAITVFDPIPVHKDDPCTVDWSKDKDGNIYLNGKLFVGITLNDVVSLPSE